MISKRFLGNGQLRMTNKRTTGKRPSGFAKGFWRAKDWRSRIQLARKKHCVGIVCWLVDSLILGRFGGSKSDLRPLSIGLSSGFADEKGRLFQNDF